MIVLLMSASASSLLAPFYPDMAKEKKGCSSLIVGMVLSSFSLSYIISSYLIGIQLSKIGRRFSIYTGIIMQVISMVGFGSLVWIPDRTLFIILSFAFRLLGGVAWGFIWVSAYAMTSIKFPETIQSKIALLEAANGAGLFVGPIFGGLIYQFTSFFVPFYLFSTIFICFLPFLKRKLTEDLDRDDTKEDSHNKIGYFELLKNKRVAFAAVSNFFNILFLTVGQPVFGPRLTHDYGLSDAWVGAWFALPTVFYIITGPFLLPKITKGFEQRAIIMLGFFTFALTGYLVGPSQIFGFPEKSAVMMISALCILGTGASFTIIPIIPEMLDATKDKYDGQLTELSDNFSAIFNISGGIGQVVGPTLAGLLSDEIGFRLTFDMIGTTVLLFNILYIVWCGGVGSIIRSFKARALHWRKKSPVSSTDSPRHHLLNDDSESQDEHINSDVEASPKGTKGRNDSSEENNDVSTDTSLLNNSNSYTIN